MTSRSLPARWWPRSMLGRNLVLLIPLVIASQLCVLALWFVLIQRPRMEDGAALVAAQISLVDRLLGSLPPDERRRALAALDGVPTDALVVAEAQSGLPDNVLIRGFLVRLRASLPPGVDLRWKRTEEDRLLWVRLRESDALWIRLAVSGTEDRLGLSGTVALLLSLTVFPMLGAYLIQRRIEGPLKRLAGAAREIEQGRWPDAVPVQPPEEMATVIESFNRMAATLAASDRTRAEMLAGISHDIRTPLTKLRMVAAAPETFDAPAQSAERFVEEIDAILGQFIDFARGASGEARVQADLNALIERLAGGYAALGHMFELELQPLPMLGYGPVAMQRLLMNLMQNAVKHGRIGLAVRSRLRDDAVEIAVEDRGPGLPAESLVLMKQPFRRGARSGESGSGLGLAIAERVAQQHGGSLDLAQRPGGGLLALLRLPKSR